MFKIEFFVLCFPMTKFHFGGIIVFYDLHTVVMITVHILPFNYMV